MKVASRYAVFADRHSANAWLALGWMPHPALERCYHGQFSVLCVWICDCEVRRPAGVQGRPPRRGFSSPGFEQGRQSEHDAVQAALQVDCQRDHDDNREGGRYGEGFW